MAVEPPSICCSLLQPIHGSYKLSNSKNSFICIPQRERKASMSILILFIEISSRCLYQRRLLRNWNYYLMSHKYLYKKDKYIIDLIHKGMLQTLFQFLGIPPSLKQYLWPILLGNNLKITPEVFRLYPFSFHLYTLCRYQARAHEQVNNKNIYPYGREQSIRLIDVVFSTSNSLTFSK